jgi:hypothetical protein
MRRFGWIQGAKAPETSWFASLCNAVADQIGHILETVKWLQSAVPARSTGQKARLSHAFGHLFAISNRQTHRMNESWP